MWVLADCVFQWISAFHLGFKLIGMELFIVFFYYYSFQVHGMCSPFFHLWYWLLVSSLFFLVTLAGNLPILLIFFKSLTLLQMSSFPPPLPTSTQLLPPLPFGYHHTVVCVYGLCRYALWPIPSPSFIRSPLSPLPFPLWQPPVSPTYPHLCLYFVSQLTLFLTFHI